MAYSEDQVMLTLSGLAYRGFQDVLPGEPHDHVGERCSTGWRRSVPFGVSGSSSGVR